ncbi:hypothetical protein V1517DRAFT_368109 [Lipomyces orientalis]|uniref:Uncharacterized protein n=1 Tax=Lipomyces orientalis TaxID=1233043 RepID=A0ACC3TLQ0_9ASCO
MKSSLMAAKIATLRAAVLSVVLVVFTVGLAISYHSLDSAQSYSLSVDVNSPDVFHTAHQAVLAKQAHNTSLGFGEIVYISMPYRTDRQDAMTLLASWYGLKLKLIPGVIGSDMSAKAIPDEAPPDLRPSVLGCYRAHANAWRYLLESGMETLLIFEDDLDWNPNIKRTLEKLSLQMQNSKIRLTEPSEHERATAPYGLDWDVLYIGSWKHGGNPDFKDLVQIWDDPDVPDSSHLTNGTLQALYEFGLADDQIGKKRVLSPSYWTVTTTAYAITRRGAERLLMLLSYIGELHGDVDQDINRFFREGRLNGYSLTPPAFSQFRVSGAKDSDNIQLGETTNGRGNLHGWSVNLEGSARQSMADSLKLANWNEYARARGAKSTASPEVMNLAVRTRSSRRIMVK